MDTNKPEPLYPARTLGTICPICGKKSYSAAGVHPQCSVVQADAPRQAALAAKKKHEKVIADAKRDHEREKEFQRRH